MRRTTVLIVTAVVVLSGAPVTTASNTTTQDDLVTLTITVVDTGGDPVGGATVTATWDGGNATETTRSNGQTLIDVPRGEDVDIHAQNSQYVRNRPYEVDSASQRDVEITVAERGSASIAARDTGNQTVERAIVRLWQDGNVIISARTNESGVHETKDIEQGEYDVFVFKEGFRKNRTTIRVNETASTSLVIDRGNEPVTFSVTDDHFDSPQPVGNATISVAGNNIRTTSNGENTVQLGVNDEYDVTITKEGYDEVTREVEVDEAPTRLNVSIQKTNALVAEPSNDRVVIGGNVSIDVTDEYDTPVEGAEITLDGNSVGQTDADGEITFPIESEGNHSVSVTTDDLDTSVTIQGVRAATAQPEGNQTETATQSQQTTSSGFGPGFTPLAALAGIVLAVLALRRFGQSK